MSKKTECNDCHNLFVTSEMVEGEEDGIKVWRCKEHAEALLVKTVSVPEKKAKKKAKKAAATVAVVEQPPVESPVTPIVETPTPVVETPVESIPQPQAVDVPRPERCASGLNCKCPSEELKKINGNWFCPEHYTLLHGANIQEWVAAKMEEKSAFGINPKELPVIAKEKTISSMVPGSTDSGTASEVLMASFKITYMGDDAMEHENYRSVAMSQRELLLRCVQDWHVERRSACQVGAQVGPHIARTIYSV